MSNTIPIWYFQSKKEGSQFDGYTTSYNLIDSHGKLIASGIENESEAIKICKKHNEEILNLIVVESTTNRIEKI